MSSGNLDSSGHTLSNNSLKSRKAFEILMYFKYTLNTLVKITEFFKTDLLYNFYSINDIDMSLGNLDSCHHTHNRRKV